MVSLFIAYRKNSDIWRDRLKAALEELAKLDGGRAFPISIWSDDHLLGGDDWEEKIAVAIDACDVFVLLVTSDLTGGYALEVELKRAINRVRRNERCKVVPVIVDNVIAFLSHAGVEEFRLHALPAGGRGITQAPFSGDVTAWLSTVVDGLKRVIELELGAGQWARLDADLLARNVQDRAHDVIDAATQDRDTFSAWPKAAFAAERTRDLLRGSSESLLSGILAIKRLVGEARREAVASSASASASSLLQLGAALDDLYDAAVAEGFQTGPPNSTDIPASHPTIRRDLSDLTGHLERAERSADELRSSVEHEAGDAQQVLEAAATQIAADARIAQAVVLADVLETATLVATTDQLAETVDSVAGQARIAGVSDKPAGHIREAKRSANKARQTAKKIHKRSLQTVGEAEAASAPEAPPTSFYADFARTFETETYRAYTTAYDEQVDADLMCEPEELDRLYEYLNNWSRNRTDPEFAVGLEDVVLENAGDVALALLVDHSGSMRGRSILQTAAALMRSCRLLEGCAVDFEVLAFTTRAWKGGSSKEEWLSRGRPENPGRLNDLRHIIYKRFESRWVTSARNLGVMVREGMLKENIDGEALIWAAKRLHRMPHPRKAIIVLSDGAPVDDATLSAMPGNYLERHLKFVIDRIRSSTDIELRAVGVGHDVSRYYPGSLAAIESAILPGYEALCEALDMTIGDVFTTKIRE